MKFRDGGKKPGYNAQICIERETEIIVGKGTDKYKRINTDDKGS